MTPEKPKHPGGRPLKFKSAEEMQALGDKFFQDCDAKSDPYTITGLAIALGTSRESLCEYEAREEFVDTIKGLKARCQNYVEKRLFGNNPTGPIFWLKNYGWKDKQEVSHEVAGIEEILSRLQSK